MIIRPLKREELEKAAEIFMEAYEDWKPEIALAYLTKFYDFEPEKCLAAESDGRLIGAVLGYTYKKKDTFILFIQELFVSPDTRHQGVGKELISSLRKACSETPRVKITPLVEAPTSVLNFYNSLGFERDQVFSFYDE